MVWAHQTNTVLVGCRGVTGRVLYVRWYRCMLMAV